MGKSDQAGRDDGPVTPSTARDANDSFVKKVTSRVSELIPNTLSRWFTSQRPLVRRRESSSSSNDDDDDEPASKHPPTKRPCLPTDRKRYVDAPIDYGLSNGSVAERSRPVEPFAKYGDSAESRFLKLYERSSEEVAPSADAGASVGREIGYSVGARNSALQAELERTARKAVSRYDRSEERANGAEKSESEDSTSGCSSMAQRNRSERCEDRFESRGRTSSRYDPVSNVSERSLFTKLNLRPDSSSSSRRPSFDVSSFGSPSLVDRTLTTERITNSPFYKGITRFGGASATLRHAPSPYEQNRKPRIAVEVRPARDAVKTDTAELSKTARRILDALEHVSSPIEDVRNMPCPNITRDRSKTSRTPYSRPHVPVTKPLVIPTVCDLLRMKRVDELRESTETVRNITARTDPVVKDPKNTPEYKLRNDDVAKRSNKMRPKISKVRGARDEMNEYSERIELPEVSLKIVDMPKFDIPMPARAAETAPTSRFRFSSPSDVSPVGVFRHDASDKFEFSAPIYVDEHDPKPKRTPSPVLKRKPLSSVKGCESAERNSIVEISTKKDERESAAETTWECETCMIGNQRSDEARCVACKTARSGVTVRQERPFEDWFRSQSDRWKCEVCLVRNAPTDAKCVACTSERPGAKPDVSSEKKVPEAPKNTAGFGDAFRPPADTWSCDVCLIRNKSDADLCVACDGPKPGAGPTKTAELSAARPIEWECPTCAVRNADSNHECVCCRTTKPGSKPKSVAVPGGAPPIGTFKFGIDKAGVEAKETVPTGFVFGKSDAVVTATGFTFGVPGSGKNGTNAAGDFTFGTAAPKKTEARFTFGIPTSENSVSERNDSNTNGESSFIVRGSKENDTVEKENAGTAVRKENIEEKPIENVQTQTSGGNSPIFASESPARNRSTFKTSPTSSSNAIVPVSDTTISVDVRSKKNEGATVCDGGKSVDIREQNPENTKLEAVESNPETVVNPKTEIAKPVNEMPPNDSKSPVTPVLFEKTETKPSVMQNHSSFESSSAKPPGIESGPALFGTGYVTTPTPGFGGKPRLEPEKKCLFGAQQTKAVGAPSFGSDGRAFRANANVDRFSDSKPSFGSGPTETSFGVSRPAKSAFGSAEPAKPIGAMSSGGAETFLKPATNGYAFDGSSSAENKPSPSLFTFGASDESKPAKVQKFPFSSDPSNRTSTFSFGSNATGGATANEPKTFAFTFGGNKPDPPTFGNVGARPTFGSTPVPGNGEQFGSFGANNKSPMFNFGTGTAQSPAKVFSFGNPQASAASSSGTAFTFGAQAASAPPSFDPNSKPMFNFSGSSAPTAFTAQHAPGMSPAIAQRKVKRAIRRTQR